MTADIPPADEKRAMDRNVRAYLDLIVDKAKEMIDGDLSAMRLVEIQDYLASATWLYGRMRGIGKGLEGPVTAARLRERATMERKQRKVFNGPLVPDINDTPSVFLCAYLQTRVMALMEIACLERERAVLEDRKKEENKEKNKEGKE